VADRRTSLLEAAERVLTERGLSATVADITEAAGVAKGTFYLYFSTKEDVIRAVQARLWEDYLRSGNAAAERLATEGWWPTIDAFIEEVVDFDIAHRDWHRLVAQGWSEPTPLGEEGQ
jgi:AcrR family transcriptional regulator